MQYSTIEHLKREIKIQKKLDHSHVLKLFHSFEDTSNVYLALGNYYRSLNTYFIRIR